MISETIQDEEEIREREREKEGARGRGGRRENSALVKRSEVKFDSRTDVEGDFTDGEGRENVWRRNIVSGRK